MYIKDILKNTLTFPVLAFVISGCSLAQMVQMAKDQKLTVDPNPLELHGEMVNYELSAVLPPKMLKTGKVYQLKSYYVYGDKEIEIKTIEFKQENFPNADKKSPDMKDKALFPYQNDFTNGDLMIKGIAVDPRNGKYKETPRLKIAEGIITTSRMVLPSYHVAYASHGYNDGEEIIPTKIDFFFAQGSDLLTYKEKKSDRGQYFDAFIAEKNLTRTVTIVGQHSPEGSERINSRLSERRAKAIEKFYKREMRKYDYKELADSIRFIIKPIIEDWMPFKNELKKYTKINQSEKQAFIDIINESGTFEGKERKLQKLPKYKKVFKDVYPKLRTAQTEILTVKKKKTNAQIATLAKQMVEGTISSDVLTDEELSFAATLTPSLSEKESIYKKAIEKSDSWASYNNLAGVYLAKALEGLDSKENLNKAIAQIEIANNKNRSAEAYTNLSTAFILQGNIPAAYDAAKEAVTLNPPNEILQGLNGILASCEIKMAKYDNALKKLNNTSEITENKYNLGLAKLLVKDYAGAETALNDLTSAKALYLKAVIAARQNNKEKAFKNLSEAVSKMPDLKNKALYDLEFKSYFETPDFKEIFK